MAAVTLGDIAGRFPPTTDPGQRPTSSAARRPYLDNLKALLIAAIIVMHAVLGYAGSMDAWSYTEVRETTLNPVVEAMVFVVDAPFVLFVFVAQPTMMYALDHRFCDATLSYWRECLGTDRQLDTGPFWFVGVLLIFSLAYAALVSRTGHRPAGLVPGLSSVGPRSSRGGRRGVPRSGLSGRCGCCPSPRCVWIGDFHGAAAGSSRGGEGRAGAVLVATVGLVGSLGVARLLISRIPGLGRII